MTTQLILYISDLTDIIYVVIWNVQLTANNHAHVQHMITLIRFDTTQLCTQFDQPINILIELIIGLTLSTKVINKEGVIT